MKSNFRTVLCHSLGMTLLLLGVVSTLQAEVRLWPAPPEEQLSQKWSVEVNGTKAAVLTARTADPPFDKNHHYGGEYGFVSLDADEPVTLKFRDQTGRSLDNLVIRPLSLGLIPKKNADGSFEIMLDRPCQISVEPDEREHPILVFVNELEKNIPDKNDPNVIWYGPGIHHPQDGLIALSSNQTLYLAPGAIVHCGIKGTGENIRLCGRGVVDSSTWEWRKGPTPHVVSLKECQNVQIEGITIRGASHWTVVPVNCDDVVIDNIKLCGGRVQNDDGINPCNSRRVMIRNCFIRTDDDCVAAKGLDKSFGNCEDITVENCILWCDRARIVLLGHESRAEYMRRIIFRNCDIIHSYGRNFLLEPGEEMKMEELLFENLRFEIGNPKTLTPVVQESANADSSTKKEDAFANARFDVDGGARGTWLFVAQPTVNQYMRTKTPGHIAACTLRNISVVSDGTPCRFLVTGKDEEHRVERFVFENIVIDGQLLEKDSPLVKIGEFTKSIGFFNPPCDTEGFRPLFDGKTLEFWHGDPGYFVRDNTIILPKGTKSHLFADAQYSNFVLKLDFRYKPAGNSGIAIRSPSIQIGEPGYEAIEIQILDDEHEKHANLKDWQLNGGLYGIVAAKPGFQQPPWEWNSYEITVKDYYVSVKLNGTLIAEADLEKMGFIRLLDKPGTTLKRRIGHIGFTGHGDEDVEFRHVRIKVL